MSQNSVRFIGSRELHRDLPKVLDQLEDPTARFILTIHSRPKAVILGTKAFLALLKGQSTSDRMLALQLGALVRGLESSAAESEESLPETSNPSGNLVGSPF